MGANEDRDSLTNVGCDFALGSRTLNLFWFNDRYGRYFSFRADRSG